MKHYYRIGEIVELYGVGPDSLRYYEKLGILKPHRGENNYRMYHIHDLWRLNVIRDLRELGFSMAQIQEYLEHRSLDSTEELLTRELSVIEKRMRALENLKSNIEDRLDVLKEIRTQPLGVIEQKYIGRRHCYTIPSGYQIDEEMDMLIKQLVNKDPNKLYIIGNNRIGSVIPLSSARAGNYRDYSQVFIIEKSGDEVIPEGIYLTVSYDGSCARNETYIPALLSYAEEHGLTPAGPILELLLADIHQTDDVQECRTELQILCETC